MDAALAAGAVIDDFSLLALFLRADLVVKLVMGILIMASIWSWAVAIDKWIGLMAVKKRAGVLEKSVTEGVFADDALNDAEKKSAAAMARVLAAGARALQENKESAELGDRLKTAMNIIASREIARLENGLGSLAIIGSTSPFIGLFGTVWGIMNSFRAIAIARETNLAVVAPGIAEALFATALGLVAAIPAVVFYNKFTGDIDRINLRMELFAEEFAALYTRSSGNDNPQR